MKLSGYSQNLSKCILLIFATKIRIQSEFLPPKKSGTNKKISQSLKLYVMCTLGEVCVMCICSVSESLTMCIWTQHTHKTMEKMTQQYLERPSHMIVLIFAQQIFPLASITWIPSCSVINHFYFIKWLLRVSLVSP